MKDRLNRMLKEPNGLRERLRGLSPEDRAHNARVRHCLKVLDEHMVENARNFVIPIDGEPAGMSAMSVPPRGSKKFPDNGVMIHGIMSLPGTKDVGIEGIKEAILMSRSVKRGGRVNLEFLPGSKSREIYEHFGFVANGSSDGKSPNSMHLSAEAANKFMQKYGGRSPHFVSTGN